MAMQQDPRNQPPTAQKGGPGARGSKLKLDALPDVEAGDSPIAQALGNPETQEEMTLRQNGWMNLARSALYSSTSYVDTNYRKVWEDSIRAFNNMHSQDSKYNSPSYEKRSRLYRPKTRTIIRKNEAAGAAAFFSNVEVLNIEPVDQTNKQEAVGADLMKALLQYRLTKTIPWFQVVMGGLQDAQVTGAACAEIYWDYEELSPEGEIDNMMPKLLETAVNAMASQVGGEAAEGEPPGPDNPQEEQKEGEQIQVDSSTPGQVVIDVQKKPTVLKDEPVIDLFPIENLRIDFGASWVDPVGTSPYLIRLIPMYVLDVKEKMKSGKWFMYSDSELAAAKETTPDSVRVARNRNKEDAMTQSQTVDDYDIIWVQRHIHRREGQDWTFYTLADIGMLTKPILLKKVILHGKRPYVIGTCNIESHKTLPSTFPQLNRGLQEEANEIANQRSDNVKFVLNKKWFVKRGKEADVPGLVRNVPGGVVMLDDPANDVKEQTWQDVTASAYEEHRALNSEMDELMGNFNPATLIPNGGAMNGPARNMILASNSSGTLVEYMLRIFAVTFVEKVLYQLMQCEQQYETDQVIIALAARNANLFQKYGVNQVTDELLQKELTLTVNVGMGATDPMQKLNKFLTGMTTYTNMLQRPAPGIDMKEVGKEIFGHLGYRDGSRFFTNDNPQVAMLQQQIQQLTGLVQQLQQKVQEKTTKHQVQAAIAQGRDATTIRKTQIHEENENKRALATHIRGLTELASTHAHARETPVQLPAVPLRALPKFPVGMK
jgi:hypothetical protein